MLTELSKYTHYVTESGCSGQATARRDSRSLQKREGTVDGVGIQRPQNLLAYPLSFTPKQPGKRNVDRNYETGHFEDLLIGNKMHCSRLGL